jgi:hypothetical protein
VRLVWRIAHVDLVPIDENAEFGQCASTAMARQLEAHPALCARLALPWTRIIVLERIARGAGSTRWYLANTRQDISRVFGMLLPGSRVTFYFGGPLRVEPVSETLIGAMFEALGEDNELVIATPGSMEPLALDAVLVFGSSELSEYLIWPRPTADVVWGRFPGTEEPDAVTVELVDADGTLRAHPH